MVSHNPFQKEYCKNLLVEGMNQRENEICRLIKDSCKHTKKAARIFTDMIKLLS